jgi:hypothetical protein
MKKHSMLFRWTALTMAALASVSCMTTYDSAGRPVQSVDPAVAVAGAAAAGLIGYAIANDNDDYHHHHHGGYYRPYRGGYRCY